MRSYFRRVNDVKYCIITGIHGDKTSHFCDALKTAVLTSPAQHDETLQTPSPTPSESRVFTRARPSLSPSETAELEVTSKSSPAMCKAYAKVSLTVSFSALMSSVRISSALEKFCEEIKSVVSSQDEIVKHKLKLSSRSETNDGAAHAEVVRERSGVQETLQLDAFMKTTNQDLSKEKICITLSPSILVSLSYALRSSSSIVMSFVRIFWRNCGSFFLRKDPTTYRRRREQSYSRVRHSTLGSFRMSSSTWCSSQLLFNC